MKDLLLKLDHCVFCKKKLIAPEKYDDVFECPSEHEPYSKTSLNLFWLYRKSNSNNRTINIVINKYQIHYKIDYDITQIIPKFGDGKTIKEFDYLLPIELDEEKIKKKLLTLVTFS